MTCLHIVVEGVVQGVGFRPFIYRIATSLKLKGYVKNLGNGTVEIFVDGDDKALSLFLDDLQHKKPPLAKIYRMQVEKVNTPVRFEGFTILESSKNGSEGSSIIPVS
ncbi:MAG: acylphosphatase, partial [Nitrososphaerales archaeon]|nr:acylphosphatase [Nitrososphaerales archaeon]